VVVFAFRRFTHHSASSGYDQLIQLFPDAGLLSLEALEQERLEWLRLAPCLEGAAPSSIENLFRAANGEIVVHVLYGDLTTAARSLRRWRIKPVVISTLHQPAWLLRDYLPDRRLLDCPDLLVTVSESQAQEIRQLGVSAPLVTIPHGIWTHTFRPPGPRMSDGSILCVGEHLRDWHFLQQVVSVLANDDQITCRLVIPERYHSHFRGLHNRVELETGLSEPQLLQRYRSASLLLLPLTSATANNTLLEAMASGCPVACNRLPALEEYLGESGCYFPTRNLAVCLDAVRSLHQSAAQQCRLSEALLERAKTYDWSRIAPRYASLYHDALRHKLP
jgi:glycosyltransferase involved in cell wall biosynthesis